MNDRNRTDYFNYPRTMLISVIVEALRRYVHSGGFRISRLAHVIGLSRNSVRNLMGDFEYKRAPQAATLRKLRRLPLGKEAQVAIDFLLDLEKLSVDGSN